MANYTLTATIVPQLASGFSHQIQTQLNNAFQHVNPTITPQLNTSQLTQTANKAGQKAGKSFGEGMKKSFKAAVVGIGAAIGGIGFGGKEVIDEAAALQAAVGSTKQIFKDNSKEMLTWADNAATAFGLSKSEALSASKNFGSFFTAVGMGTGEAAKMSKDWTGMAANMAAFADLPTADAVDAITGALRGELDPLQKYIPTISAASIQTKAFAMTGKKNAKDLTQQDKALAINTLLMESNANKAGAAELAQRGYGVQMNTLKAKIKDGAAAIGSFLLPGLTKLASIISDKVIPAVKDFWSKHGEKIKSTFITFGTVVKNVAVFIWNTLQPALAAIGKVITDTIVPAIDNFWKQHGQQLIDFFKGVQKAILETVNFIKNNSDWLSILAVGITTAVVAFKAYNAAIKIWTALTKAAAAMQVAFNVAMKANYIGLIVAAIIGLIAVVILAYKKFPAFRNLVQTVFKAIAATAMWLWNNVLKPVWSAIQIGFQFLVKAIVFAWNNILKPIFAAIGAIATWLWNNVLKPVWSAIQIGFQILVAAISIYWNNVLKPIFTAIAAIATWLWNNVLSPVWAGIKAGFGLLVDGIKAYWNGILKPIIKGIATVAMWLWHNVMQPVWEGIKKGFSLAVDGIKAVWNNVLKPVFDTIKTVIGTVKSAFQTAIDGIKVIWDKLKEIAAKPVNFVIESVYNNGIRKVWNWIADKVGLGQLDPIDPVKFARGGIAPGSGNRDTVPAMLTPGEGILTKDEMKKLGGAAGFAKLRAQITSKSRPEIETTDPIQMFKDGGVVGAIGGAWNWMKDKGKGLWDEAKGAVRGALGKVADKLISPIRDQINGADIFKSGLGPLIKGAPVKILDKIIEFVKGDDKKNAGAGGALGDLKGGQTWQWMVNTLNSNGFNFHPSLGQTTGGNHAAHSWHYSGRAVDLSPPSKSAFDWISSHYGASSKELFYSPMSYYIKNGKKVPGTFPDHYDHIHWAMDKGGMLQPGWNPPIWNGTKKPEPVLTNSQWKNVSGGLGGGGGYTLVEGDNYIEFGDIHSDVDMNMAMDRITRLTKGAGY